MKVNSPRTKQKNTKQRGILNRLWKYRKENGLTQKDVAYILGIKNPSQISHWERGDKIPGTRNMLKLSALYKRLPNDLLWGLYEELREEVIAGKKRLDNLKKKHAQAKGAKHVSGKGA